MMRIKTKEIKQMLSDVSFAPNNRFGNLQEKWGTLSGDPHSFKWELLLDASSKFTAPFSCWKVAQQLLYQAPKMVDEPTKMEQWISSHKLGRVAFIVLQGLR